MKHISFYMVLSLSACATPQTTSKDYSAVAVTKGTVTAGTAVSRGGAPIELYQGSIKEGDNINDFLGDFAAKPIDQITVINIVPSIDTPVCEAQTHVLGESKTLNPAIRRITISRDTPMAQKRFATAAHLQNVEYLSDFKFGSFGQKTGLLMKGPELLARGVIVTDAAGTIVYLQINDEITKMPDMAKAFEVANQLVTKP